MTKNDSMVAPLWGAPMDPATGMPAIPHGYFWRVKRPGWGLSYYAVELRQKLTIGSRQIASHPICRIGVDELTVERIRDSAAYLLMRNSDALSHFGKAKGVNLALLGDYPPRVLKGGDR